MDMDGHNVRKLVFNVNVIESSDNGCIYYMQEEDKRYRIVTPVSAKQENEEVVETTVTRYYAFHKDTGESELLLSLGLPSAKSFDFKGGCFRKKISKNSVIEEIPPEVKYKRENKAEEGEVAQESETKEEAAKREKKGKKAKKNNKFAETEKVSTKRRIVVYLAFAVCAVVPLIVYLIMRALH